MYYKDNEHFVEMAKVQPYINSMAFDVFIDEDIDNPEYYRSVINTFNKAAEGDVINVYINTSGGQDRTTSSIIFAMDNSKANIVGHLTGNVCSNGTIIALHCHNWLISDNVVFMCHNGIAGFYGSAEKVKKHHDFYQEHNRKIVFNEYEGFLTEEECEAIIEHGDDLWFGKEDLERRLANFVSYQQNKQSSAMQEMFNLQNEQSDKYESLLLDNLVAKGVISQEEADIAKKVQQASVELDEAEGETLFAQLNASQEDQCCGECSSEEDFLKSPISMVKFGKQRLSN
ncbi:ATP-dependent Clp protease [Pseudoalteromonas phage PH357]|nr:ATP-dependent Clp protease [Pseudoalteromonas phage PH357]